MISNVSYVHVWYFTTLVFSISFGSSRCDEGLLFNWYELALVQKPPDEFDSICEKCATARTAFNSAESSYNYENSFGKKALFLGVIFPPPIYMSQIVLPKCDGPVQPSIAYNTYKGRIEIGYEISRTTAIGGSYGTYEAFPSKNRYKEPNKLLSLYPSNPKETPYPRDVLSKYFESVKKLEEPPKKNSPDFDWISILSVTINIDTFSPIQIEYNPDFGMHLERENCNKFDVGKEFYTQNSFDSFYSHENQKKLFVGFENQPALSFKAESIHSGEKYECGQKYGCLVQHQIIPTYYFHSNYGALAICSLMNTVPIWESVVERINIVDKYLYAIVQIWGRNIHLKNGFSGTLESTKKYFEKKSKSRHEVYLDQKNNNITIPLIFYKIVEYEVIKLPPRPDETDNYFAVIVIHNDFATDTEQKICEENDIVEGWGDIQNNDSQSGLTYVCELTKDVALKLNVYEGNLAMLDPGDELPLRLDEFPIFDAVQRKYLYEDKRSEIKNKIKELFEKKEDEVIDVETTNS